MSRHCAFLGNRRSSLIRTRTSLRRVVRRLSITVHGRFARRFTEVTARFGSMFHRLFKNKGNSLRLRRSMSVLRTKVHVVTRPPKGGLRGVVRLSNKRGTLATVTLLFTVRGLGPSPFYLLSRVRTTLSSGGMSHCTGCLRGLAGCARFVIVAREHNAVTTTSQLCKVAVRRGNVSALISISLLRSSLRGWAYFCYGRNVGEAKNLGVKRRGGKFFGQLMSNLAGAESGVISNVSDVFRKFSGVSSSFCRRLRRALVVKSLNIETAVSVVRSLGIGMGRRRVGRPVRYERLIVSDVHRRVSIKRATCRFRGHRDIIFIVKMGNINGAAAVNGLTKGLGTRGGGIVLTTTSAFHTTTKRRLGR